MADLGEYTCTVSNSEGAVTSTPAELWLASCPPEIVQGPAPRILVPLGGSTALEVVAVAAPTPQYQWEKDGVPLVGNTAPTMLLTASSARVAGSYTCRVWNVVGDVRSKPCAVVIEDSPPQFTAQSRDTSVAQHATLSLSVSVSGHPQPTLQVSCCVCSCEPRRS